MTAEALLSSLRAPGTAPIHQIGIVVASCDEAVACYSGLLGYRDWRRTSFGPGDVRRMTLRGSDAAYSMRLAFAGEAPELELIEPVEGQARRSRRSSGPASPTSSPATASHRPARAATPTSTRATHSASSSKPSSCPDYQSSSRRWKKNRPDGPPSGSVAR
jgi:hypothetical protein